MLSGIAFSTSPSSTTAPAELCRATVIVVDRRPPLDGLGTGLHSPETILNCGHAVNGGCRRCAAAGCPLWPTGSSLRACSSCRSAMCWRMLCKRHTLGCSSLQTGCRPWGTRSGEWAAAHEAVLPWARSMAGCIEGLPGVLITQLWALGAPHPSLPAPAATAAAASLPPATAPPLRRALPLPPPHLLLLQQAATAAAPADHAAAPAAPACVCTVGPQGQGGQHLQGGAQGGGRPRRSICARRWVLRPGTVVCHSRATRERASALRKHCVCIAFACANCPALLSPALHRSRSR